MYYSYLTYLPFNILTMKTFDLTTLTSLLTSDYIKQELENKLKLAIIVDLNYDHITQLEELRDVMLSGLGDYHKKYHPELETITTTVAELIENTRSNHYLRDNENLLPSVHSVYKEIFGHHHVEGKRKPIIK